MTSIPLSQDALRGAKRVVQKVFPDFKSSHLSEALAAGLGFRSHAALLVRNKDVDPADPDYALFDNAVFERRLCELSGETWPYEPEHSLDDIDFKEVGGIRTWSPDADEIDYSKSMRLRAWRNLMVAAINAGLEQRLFTVRSGDNRWQGWTPDRRSAAGMRFKFELEGLPGIGWVNDIGFGELSIHAALWPANERFIGSINAGFLAGDAWATGKLERMDGVWLKSNGAGPQNGWYFACRKSRLHELASIQVRPQGYLDRGSFKF